MINKVYPVYSVSGNVVKWLEGKNNTLTDVLSRAVSIAQIENSITSSLSIEKSTELQKCDFKCSEIINLLSNQDSVAIGKKKSFS